MSIIIWCLMAHVVCAVLAYPAVFADLQNPSFSAESNRESWHTDVRFAAFFSAFFGPIALLVSLLITNFCQHGYRWK